MRFAGPNRAAHFYALAAALCRRAVVRPHQG
jgi:hypothetical protein